MCDSSTDNSILGSSATPEDELDEVRSVNFNQDFSSLSVGTVRGYKIFDCLKNDELQELCYNIYATDPPEVVNSQGTARNCLIVQRLYSSSLVAVVSEDHPRKLSVNHFKKNSHICLYTYPRSILTVLLNRERLVVVCEDRLSIHVVKDMELIHTIADTPVNPAGVCALANSTANCYLAYPASTTEGVVQIFDAFSLKSVVQIAAHDSPLQCLAFNDDGTKLATASVKGTVIRVFDVSPAEGGQGRKLFELRRGLSRSVTIHSLSFSQDSQFLLASSNTPTIHVFRLQSAAQQPPATDYSTASYASTVFGLLNSAVSASAAYLPAQVAGIMVQERAFAWASLPSEGRVTRVGLTNINKVPRVMVATINGMVYMYDFNPVLGGECKLVRQHNLSPNAPTEGLLETASMEVGAAAAASDAGKPLTVVQAEADKVYAMQKATQPPPVPALALDDPTQFPPV